MNRSLRVRVRILALVVLPPVVAALASIVGMLLLSDLPSPLATHWGIDGSVDGTGSLGSYIALVGVLVGLFTAGVVGFSASPLIHGTSTLFARTVVGLSTWFGIFIALSMYLGVRAQQGIADPATVPSSSVLVALLIAFGVAVVVAAAAVVLTPRVPAAAGLSADPLTMALGEGEVAYWARTATSPRGVIAIPIAAFAIVAVLFIVVGVPLWAIAIVGIVLASLFTMLAWRVVVDRHGLSVTGLFGFPRFRVPLESVVAATVTTVTPFGEFGGWGVRVGRSGRWGVVVRSGEAIEVQRRSGANFVVTVDDATTAAALLTGLARRS